MTEVEDIIDNVEYESLRRLLDSCRNVEQVERKLRHRQPGGLTMTQAVLFGEYFQLREEREEEEEERERTVVRARLIASFVMRSGKRYRVFRDKRGRFASLRGRK